ncbi:MAG: amidohydrolase family protein [Verrucomicrobiales bacterium]|nr:amidohydrolase family protein [Verrucomicrobiales bacterium]
MPNRFALRARVLLPINRPPFEDGAVVVAGDRIEAVGRWRHIKRTFSGEVIDLGERILLPGLVNGHCHLDYTHMAGLFPPQKSFCDWIKLITEEKLLWSTADFAESWRAGARALARNGSTTVADVESVPALLPKVWDEVPLRVFSFLEITGVRSRTAPEPILAEVLEKIATLRHERCSAGIAPHAPYSTTKKLLRLTAAAARKHKLRVMIHLAESAPEFEMFMLRRGEMFDWMRRNQRDMSDCGGVSPVRHLARAGLLSRRLLAVHVNYLARGDAALLARKGVNIVHCPRSHAYFGHCRFQFEKLVRAGVNICLGTDSLASVRANPKQQIELNMFEEMRTFANAHTEVSPETILRMATVNGAVALGMKGLIGELRRGAFADIIALPVPSALRRTYEAVLEHSGPVAASMIGGQWAIAPD